MKSKIELVYQTESGKAYRGDSREIVGTKYLKKNSVDLIVTSPPFALEQPKRYGNKNKSDYLDWLESFFEGWKHVLKDTGLIVVDIGNSYEKAGPKDAEPRRGKPPTWYKEHDIPQFDRMITNPNGAVIRVKESEYQRNLDNLTDEIPVIRDN